MASSPGRGSADRSTSELLYKDAVLDRLADVANVAQFVSFSPGPDLEQRFARLRGCPPNERFPSADRAVAALLEASQEASVNVRSFDPASPKRRAFRYGLQTVDAVMEELRRLASHGLFTIVNETIDVNDGGVSGVALGGVLEFAPGDTPRAVEKPGTLGIGIELGLRLLERVYHFRPSVGYPPDVRVEFSIHPLRRGVRHEHTIIWEAEQVGAVELSASPSWPNRFSRLIGDKAFGLLVADLLDLPVPFTTVISRGVAPFEFGKPTGTGETWIRTCPFEQMPGRFTTRKGWCDPFRLLADEDPAAKYLASVLAQEGVEPVYSGALVAGPDGSPIVEGVRGSGETFMLGRAAPDTLPPGVVSSVQHLFDRASNELGPVRFEWVYNGEQTWVVQLHRGATRTSGRTIYPGEARVYHRFDVTKPIDELRDLIARVQGTGEGIILTGNIGVTSHMGDLLRRAKIPSRIELVEKRLRVRFTAPRPSRGGTDPDRAPIRPGEEP